MSLELARTRHRLLFSALTTIWFLPVPAHGQVPADVIVNGGGKAVLSAPPPEGGAERKYAIQFTMIAGFDEDTPRGYVSFTFGQAFARDWGAVPPNDAVSVSGKVNEITQDTDGFIHLTGTLTETDFTNGQGVVFLIDDAFDVKVGGSLPPNEFVLQWCLLPEFPIRVTNGVLTVNTPAVGLTESRVPPGMSIRLIDAGDAGVTCARGRSN